MTEIPTAAGKLYLATVIDLHSRRLLGAATGLHPDAELAGAAIKMAVASRGGVDAVNGPSWREDEAQRVIFHTDRGSTYTVFFSSWRGRSSHATSSRTPARPRPSCWTGATRSTTTGTALRA